MVEPLEVFCCYAHNDRDLLQLLRKHLASLERLGLIKVWSDMNIEGGTEWEKELQRHLETADIFLLLISSEFIASDYCYSKEMKHALERHQAGDAQVIPVLLRPTLWQGAPFETLEMIPTKAVPVTKWPGAPRYDGAFLDITEHIQRATFQHHTRHSLQQARAFRQAGRYKEALAHYEAFLRLDPRNGDVLFEKAQILYLLGSLDASIKAFDHAEQIDPAAADSAAWHIQALALRMSGRQKASLAAYNRALSLDEFNAALHAEKADLLIEMKAYDEALKALEQAQYWQSDEVEYITRAGDVLMYNGRFESALAKYTLARNLEPDQASHCGAAGLVLLKLKRYEEALLAYKDALALSPDGEYYEKAAQIALHLRLFAEAVDLYRDALLSIDHPEPSLYAGQGQALFELQRYEDAMLAYQNALQLSNASTDPRRYREWERWFSRSRDEAKKSKQMSKRSGGLTKAPPQTSRTASVAPDLSSSPPQKQTGKAPRQRHTITSRPARTGSSRPSAAATTIDPQSTPTTPLPQAPVVEVRQSLLKTVLTLGGIVLMLASCMFCQTTIIHNLGNMSGTSYASTSPATGQASNGVQPLHNPGSTATTGSHPQTPTPTANHQPTVRPTGKPTAKPTPTTPPPDNYYGGHFLYSDPMSSSNSPFLWQTGTNQYGTCTFTGGGYHVSGQCDSQNFTIIPSHFAFEIRLGAGHSCGELQFDSQDMVNAFFVTICQDGNYKLDSLIDTNTTNGPSGSVGDAMNTDPSASNVIAVVADGTNITLWVNHSEIDHMDDRGYGGSVSLYGQGANPNDKREVVYTDAYLWSL